MLRVVLRGGVRGFKGVMLHVATCKMLLVAPVVIMSKNQCDVCAPANPQGLFLRPRAPVAVKVSCVSLGQPKSKLGRLELDLIEVWGHSNTPGG